MGKVFTITEGLENMGAMKTGGQGSVYKGRRLGEIITAVKLLPTPIYSESEEDKNFIDFQNEVAKLKKVNEVPNPNVVKILSSGVTDTGNFPFIEMEFIEGPDMEELLKPPHEAIFTVKEAIKVAEQLSNALAHCHKVEVKHGDIKSNNVKYNQHSGNYVLLDFGLAVMSDEQRRTSLRHAGAIEFMAPEQNEGQMLYQTDVYSFGVILFELLAGQVPFPLHDRGETARNTVMVAHMETPPPDIHTLRLQNMPDTWSAEKKDHEMLLPEWLVSMIYKCLEKQPQARFADGLELHEYILLNSTLAAKKSDLAGEVTDTLQVENHKLLSENDRLQKLILQYQQQSSIQEKEIDELKAIVVHKDSEVQQLKSRPVETSYATAAVTPKQQGVSRSSFYALLFVTALLTAFAAYSFFSNNKRENRVASDTTTSTSETVVPVTDSRIENNPAPSTENTEVKEDPAATYEIPDREEEKRSDTIVKTPAPAPLTEPKKEEKEEPEPVKKEEKKEEEKPSGNSGNYKVVAERAFFHNEPDVNTRRNAWMIPSKDLVKVISERNGFFYVEFTNTSGQTSKGWLKKSDLQKVEE
jgi:serine/threonine-protein kinase